MGFTGVGEAGRNTAVIPFPRQTEEDGLFEEGRSEFHQAGIPAHVLGPVPRVSRVQTHLSPTQPLRPVIEAI